MTEITPEIQQKLADLSRRQREEEARRTAEAGAVGIDAQLKSTLDRMNEIAEQSRQFTALHRAWGEKQSQSLLCPLHNFARQIDWDKSASRSWQERRNILVYSPCPDCVRASKAMIADPWLIRAGVPRNLIHCSFSGFKAETEEEKANLATAQKFARARQGFLVLLGSIERLGNGKSHLSIAVLREQGHGMFLTTLELFNRIRKSFDSRARIIERCKTTRLLVLDEFGFTPGYDDELPMLHDILNTRHGDKLKTILNGNFETREEFLAEVGKRMASRLDESGFKLCWFNGNSRRPEMKQAYFDEK